MENIPKEMEFVFELPTELDTWLDKEYLKIISEDIVTLEDYVPKTIELHLPNYEDRATFIQNNSKLTNSQEFHKKQFLDQMAMDTSWEEHVSLYDDFFNNHPEFSKLIKDRTAYEKWRLEEVPYYDVGED